MSEYLLTFSNCFLTKGATRSCIFDYQREDLYFIENVFYDFLMQCRSKPLSQIKEAFSDKISSDDLDEFIAFCEKNELTFLTDTPEYFPEIAVKFEHPSLVSNAIIDINSNSTHDYNLLFEELQSVACKDVQMRFFDELKLNELIAIISSFRINQHGQSLELIIKSTPELTDDALIDLTRRFIFIKSIVVHSSERNEVFRSYSHALRAGMGNILFTSQNIDSSVHCGIIHHSSFNFNNIAAYMEARLMNSCLNKKVGIDTDGAIKNCPSQTKNFGYIGQDSLLDICIHEDFQKLWSVKKDDISVCKDCEFRYICSDCRIFVRDTEDQYSKPAKCTYDPYSANWH